MSRAHKIILSSGGLRSLVATAMAQAEADSPRITLLHVLDGRDNAPIRLKHARDQAEHFALSKTVTIEMLDLYGGKTLSPDGRAVGTMILPRMVLAAVAWARQHQAEMVIWPGSCNGDNLTLTRLTETLLLCEHLGQLEEAGKGPRIESPLLELTDAQVVELGVQLGVPWSMAWSCLVPATSACGVCPACRRRDKAFEAAGVVDPITRYAAA